MRKLYYGLRHPHEYEWKRLRPYQAHSRVLMVTGIAYVLFGIMIYGVSNPQRTQAIQWILDWVPLGFWSGCFVVVGLLAILSSRWPPASDTWGYSAMAGFSCAWGTFYAVGWGLFDAPASALGSTLIWWLLSFIWLSVSALVNPDVVHHSIKRGFEEEG